MKILLDSFVIIFPLLALVTIGYYIKNIGLLSDNTIKELNRIIVSLLIPVNVFMSIYNSDFKTDFNMKFVLYAMSCVFLSFVFAYFIFNKIGSNKQKASLIQASVRPNIAIIGIPLAISIYGPSVSGIIAIGVAFCAPLYNIFSLIVFETLSNNKYDVLNIVKKLIKNPILIATVIAFILKFINLGMPEMFYETLSYISKSTTGISLIVLGASFKFHRSDNIKLISIALLIKMFMIPGVILFVGALLGFKDHFLVSLLAIFAAPVAVSSYAYASAYDSELELTSSIIIYSYIVSVLSLPVFISIVRILKLI